jgi:hypothetical protein
MKAVRFFNPLHAMGSPVTEADIDGLSLCKFFIIQKLALLSRR